MSILLMCPGIINRRLLFTGNGYAFVQSGLATDTDGTKFSGGATETWAETVSFTNGGSNLLYGRNSPNQDQRLNSYEPNVTLCGILPARHVNVSTSRRTRHDLYRRGSIVVLNTSMRPRDFEAHRRTRRTSSSIVNAKVIGRSRCARDEVIRVRHEGVSQESGITCRGSPATQHRYDEITSMTQRCTDRTTVRCPPISISTLTTRLT